MWDLPLFYAGIQFVENVSKKYGTWAAVLAGVAAVALFVLYIYLACGPQFKKEGKKRKKQTMRNCAVSIFLEPKYFNKSESVDFHSATGGTYFLMDDNHKQFGVLKYEGENEDLAVREWYRFKYSSLLDFDIKVNGVSVLSEDRKKKLLAEVTDDITDNIPDVVGEAGISTGECSSCVVNIVVDDTENPMISIDCLGGKIYKVSSYEYEEMSSNVNKVAADLAYIKVNG